MPTINVRTAEQKQDLARRILTQAARLNVRTEDIVLFLRENLHLCGRSCAVQSWLRVRHGMDTTPNTPLWALRQTLAWVNRHGTDGKPAPQDPLGPTLASVPAPKPAEPAPRVPDALVEALNAVMDNALTIVAAVTRLLSRQEFRR